MTTNASVDVLVISGPAGVGKSSTAFALSDQLRAEGVAHAVIDTDELDRIYPVPDDLSRVTEHNLAAVWSGFRDRGVTRLILVGVFADRPAELDWIGRAVPGAAFTLIRLVAPWSTLEDRITKREIGLGRAAQLERTASQVAVMQADQRREVHLVDTATLSLEAAAREVGRLWIRSS